MKGQTNQSILLGRFQRFLRSNMTEAERKLWLRLRGRQLHGWKFRRQHPYGDSILDFVCLDARLVVEVDGGQHAERQGADVARDEYLRSAGFRVLRFWNNQVLQELDAVLHAIVAALPATPPPPIPAFPLKGKGKPPWFHNGSLPFKGRAREGMGLCEAQVRVFA